MYNVSSNFLSAIQGDSRNVKVQAIFNGTSTITGDNIIDITFEEMLNSSDGLTMGAACSSKITIKMIMPSTTIALANGSVVPKVGLDINGTIEYVPLGKFYITDIESSDDYNIVTITGYDMMCKLGEEYTTTITTFPASISSVVNDIATQYGFAVETTTFPAYTVENIEGSCRDYLGWIAGLMGKNACFNRDGNLEFRWYETATIAPSSCTISNEILTITNAICENEFLYLGNNFSVEDETLIFSDEEDNDYTIPRSLQYKDGLKRIGTNLCTISSLTSGTDENVLTAGNGFGITFENPFMTQAILNSIMTSIGQPQFYPCTVKWRGNPAIEVGDIIKVIDKNGNLLNVYVMEQSFSIGGGLNCEISCYGETEVSQAFAVSSPVERKIAQKFDVLQESIAEATRQISGANGGIFRITDSNNDGINDGWLLAEHDGPLTATTKCIVGNYQGIGLSTNGGATYTQAITHNGILASAVVVSDLNAFGATIGGWRITNSYIDSIVAESNKRLFLASASDSSSYWMGAVDTNGDCVFYVTKEGKLYSKNAEIEGKITASTGSIGGWSLSNGVLEGVSGNYKARMSKVAIGSADTVVFGVYNGSAWSFYVDGQGNLNSTSGTIGGWSINSNSIEATSGSYRAIISKSSVGVSGNVVFGVYNGSSWSAYMDGQGKLYASNAVITGNITATSLNISGATITGTISTSNLSSSVITTTNFSAKTLSTSYLTIKAGCVIGATTYNATLENRSGYIYISAAGPTSYGTTVNELVRQAVSSSSNRDIKNGIHNFDDRYDTFFDKLKPQLYKYNFEPSEGYSMGYIWQETEEALYESDLTRNDVGAIYESEAINGGLGLRKEDFIALNTWQIQKLKARVNELEEMVKCLMK